MKKGFTLLEIIIVLVITAIIFSISGDIINSIYQRYKKQEAINRLENRINLRLKELQTLLTNRIDNSLIALQCNVDNNGCYNGDIIFWKRLSEVKPDEQNLYPAVEFMVSDPLIRRGAWDNDHMQLGYSGMIDLKNSTNNGNGSFSLKILDSNFDIVDKLEKEKIKEYEPDYSGDPFLDKRAVLVFSGPDGFGEFFSDSNSFGYYKTTPSSIFEITGYTQSNENVFANVKELKYNQYADAYERFFIVDNTIALIPKKQSNGFYSLYLFDNYYPWLGQTFAKNGIPHLFLTNISNLSFKEDLNKIVINLCLIDPNLKTSDGKYIQICKEKIIN